MFFLQELGSSNSLLGRPRFSALTGQPQVLTDQNSRPTIYNNSPDRRIANNSKQSISNQDLDPVLQRYNKTFHNNNQSKFVPANKMNPIQSYEQIAALQSSRDIGSTDRISQETSKLSMLGEATVRPTNIEIKSLAKEGQFFRPMSNAVLSRKQNNLSYAENEPLQVNGTTVQKQIKANGKLNDKAFIETQKYGQIKAYQKEVSFFGIGRKNRIFANNQESESQSQMYLQSQEINQKSIVDSRSSSVQQTIYDASQSNRNRRRSRNLEPNSIMLQQPLCANDAVSDRQLDSSSRGHLLKQNFNDNCSQNLSPERISTEPLFQQIGGIAGTRKLVEQWLVSSEFHSANDKGSIDRLIQRYTMLIAHLLGGEEHYIGKKIRDVHHALSISNKQFDDLLQKLIEALDRSKVEFKIGCKIIQKVERMRPLIVHESQIQKATSALQDETIISKIVETAYNLAQTSQLNLFQEMMSKYQNKEQFIYNYTVFVISLFDPSGHQSSQDSQQRDQFMQLKPGQFDRLMILFDVACDRIQIGLADKQLFMAKLEEKRDCMIEPESAGSVSGEQNNLGEINNQLIILEAKLDQLAEFASQAPEKMLINQDSTVDQQAITALQQIVRNVEQLEKKLRAVKGIVIQTIRSESQTWPNQNPCEKQDCQIAGLGEFKAVALQCGKERLISLVDEDINRMRQRIEGARHPRLTLLLILFRKQLLKIAKSKPPDQLSNTIASRWSCEITPEKSESTSEQEKSSNLKNWDLTGPKQSVGQKLGHLSNQQLNHEGDRQPNLFDSSERVCWESPLTKDPTKKLNFSRVVSTADSTWLLQNEFEEWTEARQKLSLKIGPLSENRFDEYFSMLFQTKVTATSQIQRVYENCHHFALLKNFWNSGRDKLEVGYLLSGLMNWLDDQRIATLYVFAEDKQVEFFQAMRFQLVSDQQERNRIQRHMASCTLNLKMMSIRLPNWHKNEPYELDFGQCRIPTPESRALRLLHQDLRETGAIHLIRHIAAESFFRKAHRNEESNPHDRAQETDQVETPRNIIDHVSKTIRVPIKAIYDPYIFNKKWQNGHHFNAIQMHSKAPKVSFLNMPYSSAASHTLQHSFLNLESDTSAVFLVEQQSCDNANVKAVMEALSTNKCAGHIRFVGFERPHSKSMTLHYQLSPDLLEYKEWLRQNKYYGKSRRIPDSMRLSARSHAKKDIALKLLKQGASADIACSLAQLDKNKVLQLKKTLDPIFRVVKDKTDRKVLKIVRCVRPINLEN